MEDATNRLFIPVLESCRTCGPACRGLSPCTVRQSRPSLRASRPSQDRGDPHIKAHMEPWVWARLLVLDSSFSYTIAHGILPGTNPSTAFSPSNNDR